MATTITMTAPKKILFLCNSDLGQSNVILATAYAILATGTPVEIHIGSEPAMKPEVEATARLANATLPASAPHKIHFHAIDGLSHFTAMSRPETGTRECWDLPLPNFANAAAFLSRYSYSVTPWEADELVDKYAQNVALIKEVNPDVTVVDPLNSPGLTAARQLKIQWIILAPNTVKDFAFLYAPYGAGLWKYPVLGSALPYPIPWSLIPMNIALTFVLVKGALTDTRAKLAARRLREHAGDEKLTVMNVVELGFNSPPPGLRLMVAFSRDIDYHMDVIPDHILECGPIVRHAQKLADTDSGLNEWLSKGPSIYINLGSQMKTTAVQGLEFALALRDFLDAAGPSSGYQILWKVKQEGSKGKEALSWEGEWAAVRETLQPELESDRVRITSWVEADPCSILQSGHVVCSVHQGGANSHNEALVAGVPQVVLPGWIDCYDFANRVELNGVGIRANKTAAPRWARGEFGEALQAVMLGKRAAVFRENARKLAKRHPEHAGRTKAAKIILDMLDL